MGTEDALQIDPVHLLTVYSGCAEQSTNWHACVGYRMLELLTESRTEYGFLMRLVHVHNRSPTSVHFRNNNYLELAHQKTVKNTFPLLSLLLSAKAAKAAKCQSSRDWDLATSATFRALTDHESAQSSKSKIKILLMRHWCKFQTGLYYSGCNTFPVI